MTDSQRGTVMKMDIRLCVCVPVGPVCLGGPGPCWGPAGREGEFDCAGAGGGAGGGAGADVGAGAREGEGVRVRESVGANVRWREGWRSLRSPVRGSSRSRWPRSRCGSDSGAYPSPHR